MKYLIITLFTLLSLIGQSQAQQQIQRIETDEQKSQQYSEAQLAQILAPIALYPDTLLTHILIASTYPLELVQAQRWLEKHDALSPQRLADKLQDEVNENNWDASVKALMAFPSVVKRLSDDLDWTQQLGDAFLSNEAQVLASVQQLRSQAQKAGSLAQMTNSTVSYEGQNIIIESQQPQVIYVPYYDSRQVYGTWHWGHYPPVYWAIPKHFQSVQYSSHSSSHYNSPYYQPFYWHTGVHISHRLFFGAFHWQNRHVVVINHNKKRHYGHHRYNGHPHSNRAKIVTSTGAKRWKHKPQHRRGVSYSNKQSNKRFNKHVKKHINAKQHHTQLSNNGVKRGAVIKTTQAKSNRHYQAPKSVKHFKRTQKKQHVIKPTHNTSSKIQKNHNIVKKSIIKSEKLVRKNVVRQKNVVRKNRKVEQHKSKGKRHSNKSHRIASTNKTNNSKSVRRKER